MTKERRELINELYAIAKVVWFSGPLLREEMAKRITLVADRLVLLDAQEKQDAGAAELTPKTPGEPVP